MQKQHVKLSKQLSSRALPSRPQSDNVKLRSLPSTPAITGTRPLSSLSSLSPSAGKLAPLLLTMENDAANTYNTADGCVFSKTTTEGNKSTPNDDILEYASSLTIKQLTSEHKFRSLPHLPTSSTGDGMYSVVSGDRSPDPLVSDGMYPVASDAAEQSQGIVHSGPGVKKISEGVYGVVNQPKSDFLLSPTERMSESVYGVVNQPKYDDLFSVDPPTDEDNYSIVNQPKSDFLLSPTERMGESVYDVVNQPKCDDLFSVDPSTDEDNYGVVNQPKCDFLFPPKEMNEGVYGVVNQPKCDDLSLIDPPTSEDDYNIVNQPYKDFLLTPYSSVRKMSESVDGVINQPMSDKPIPDDNKPAVEEKLKGPFPEE